MTTVLLHSCCAPCSAAILEWLHDNNYATTIFFYNPNIFPQEEYLRRKEEIVRYAAQIGVPIVDYDDRDWTAEHDGWRKELCHLASEPERGARCLECFRYRLLRTAQYASEHGFECFTTTLASSRWKDLNQIIAAGNWAASQYPGGATFWDRNWRKGGLYERRNELAKQFYNQQYCGCEYSMKNNK